MGQEEQRTFLLYGRVGLWISLLIVTLGITCNKKPPTSNDNNPPPQEYDPRNISRTETSSYTPSLDVRGDRVVVVWKDSIQGNNWDIMYRERVGDTWGEILNLSNTPGFSGAPQVAIDVHGNVHVVWEEDQTKIYYRYKDVNGIWHPKMLLSEGHLPQIQSDENGIVHLLWVGSSGGLEYQPKTPNGWGERENLPYLLAENPALHVAPDGYLFAVAEAGPGYTPDIYFYERPPGAGWSPYFNVTQNTSYCWLPSVFGLSNGMAYVSWTEYGMNRIGYRVRNADGSWEDVDTLPGIQGGPWTSFIYGSGDTLVIVWEEKRRNWEIYYRMKIGNKWGEIVNITNTEGESFMGLYPKVRNGVLYIVWLDNSDGFFDIFYDEIPLHF